ARAQTAGRRGTVAAAGRGAPPALHTPAAHRRIAAFAAVSPPCRQRWIRPPRSAAMATRSSSPPRTVLVLRTGSQPREDHERTTQEWVARRLAEALGWRYGGAFDPQRRPPPGGCYLVPDETLTCAQARHLGIRDEDDLFGGVVPHPFVASKVITHPLPGADAA